MHARLDLIIHAAPIEVISPSYTSRVADNMCTKLGQLMASDNA